jgi:acyl carrier protein
MELATIRRHLIEAVASTIHVSPNELVPGATFDAIGFDSMSKVGIVPALERTFGCALAPDVLFDHPTVESLATHVFEVLAKSTGGAPEACPEPLP